MPDSNSPSVVRPMDPRWLKSFLSTKKLDKKLISRVVAAVAKYNKACNKASDKFLDDLKRINRE